MSPPDDRDTVPGTLEELRPWLRDMRQELERNTAATERLSADTRSLVQAFEAARGFWAVIGWVGDVGTKVAKFAAICAVSGAAAWLAVKGFFENRGG